MHALPIDEKRHVAPRAFQAVGKSKHVRYVPSNHAVATHSDPEASSRQASLSCRTSREGMSALPSTPAAA
jgi:hypothetical protein